MMADNRLVAVCLDSGCDNGLTPAAPHRKTIAKFNFAEGWYLVEEGTADFFAAHNHGWRNCIVFVPEDPELPGFIDEAVSARAVSQLLHGKTEF